MQDRLKAFLKNVKLHESILSMVLGIVTIVVVGLLVFNFWNQNRVIDIADIGDKTEVIEKVGNVEVVERKDGKRYATNLPKVYVVKTGDHLWKISETLYGSGYNWVDIVSANKLADPGMLLVGQVLEIPDTAVITLEKPADPAYTMKPGQTVIEGASYTVEQGDTLWDVSVRAYQDGYRWPELSRVNNLANSNLIEVGQVLSIPR